MDLPKWLYLTCKRGDIKPYLRQYPKPPSKTKSRSALVSSKSGEEAHGLLWLVIIASEYDMASPTPFIRPVHPGVLVIPTWTNQHNCSIFIEEQEIEEKLFREYIDVDNDILKQHVYDIKSLYLNELRDDVLNTIYGDVAMDLEYLFENYEIVEHGEIDLKEE